MPFEFATELYNQNKDSPYNNVLAMIDSNKFSARAQWDVVRLDNAYQHEQTIDKLSPFPIPSRLRLDQFPHVEEREFWDYFGPSRFERQRLDYEFGGANFYDSLPHNCHVYYPLGFLPLDSDFVKLLEAHCKMGVAVL